MHLVQSQILIPVTLVVVVGTIATTVGDFLGEEGKLSSDVMRIQDNFYYQDYSYVVKVSESINGGEMQSSQLFTHLVGQSLVRLKLKV